MTSSFVITWILSGLGWAAKWLQIIHSFTELSFTAVIISFIHFNFNISVV